MSKDKLEVISADHSDRIARIKSYHTHVLGAFKSQMGYAFLCGAELNQLKDICGHGPFGELGKRYLPDVPERSRQRYMKFADALKSKSATVADLSQSPKLLTCGGDLPAKEQEAILKAVHDAADGKTLTELYRDLGVIRQPKRPGSEGRAPSSPKNLRQTESQRDAAANTNISEILAALELARDHGDFKRLTDDTRDRARDLFIELGKLLTGKKGKAK